MPMQDGYDWQQLKFRDQHGGLSWDEVKVTAERRARERVRSSPDKRLFDSMTVQQDEAFRQIGLAKMLETNGVGFRVMRFEDTGRQTGEAAEKDSQALLVAHYRVWRRECQRQRISGLMAEDVIVYGLSLRESDEGRRMRNGTAKANLFKCLDAWWDVRSGDTAALIEGLEKKMLDKSGSNKAVF